MDFLDIKIVQNKADEENSRMHSNGTLMHKKKKMEGKTGAGQCSHVIIYNVNILALQEIITEGLTLKEQQIFSKGKSVEK